MLFTEPVLFVFTVWSAFMLGTVYVFTQSVEQVFSGLYGWTASQAGYVQAAVVIGECVGWTGVLINAKL
ncbi:multidrug transporter, partial [Aspergillus sclerotialis]